MIDIILYLEFDGLPPTANNIYRNSGSRRYKRQDVINWQDNVVKLLHKRYSVNQTLTSGSNMVKLQLPYRGRVGVNIEFITNNRRRWDIDNRLKALLDCLELANIIENDSQIDSISVCRYRGDQNITKLTLYIVNRIVTN